ncbi:MAG: hypothetical protein E7461_06300 [Ruminococcaceae bacterium]|nr:hypothetical protein [Oscillospiraceae bacterium]
MSASNKKKLRKEQITAKMTERQTQEQKEAKQLKRYTAAFISVIAIVLVAAIGIVAVRGVVQSGMLQKKSVAAVVGGKELNAVELSYYYFDAIDKAYSEWYNQYGSNTATYLQILEGLDVNKPLEDQIADSKTNKTWADHFVETALENAKRTYLLCDLAKKANFKLSEDDVKAIDSQISMQQLYAVYYYGYSDFNKYLGSTYCYGANEESFRTYLEQNQLAEAYLAHYTESLSYTDAQITEYVKDKLTDYNSYTYSSVYLSYTYFLGEGTKDDKGNVTYTDAERDAARAKAKEVATNLLSAKTFEDLEKAVKALDINKDKENAKATNNKNVIGSKLPGLMKDWITSGDRVKGNNSVIVNEYTPTDDNKDDGKEPEKVINGYYVVLFDSVNDNKVPTVDVHHLLKQFKGGTKGEDGKTTYTDAEKKTAKEAAEKLLKDWEAMEGGKTLENFKKLVEKNTDDTASAATGGLYENISYDQNLVEPFLNWCIDENRKVGDVEIVETEYGYHIMYFAERNEMSYRDLLITNDMRTEDSKKWYDEQFKTITGSLKDLEWIATDATIGSR